MNFWMIFRVALLAIMRNKIGMGKHLNCGGDFGAERRCFGELSKKQDDDMTT